MSDMQIQQVLNEMRRLSATASGSASNGAQAAEGGASADFARTLQQSLQQVNDTQQKSAELATAFQLGDPQVSLSQVMLAGQKASLGFEATVQVRNKLLSAYQEIMNMQV